MPHKRFKIMLLGHSPLWGWLASLDTHHIVGIFLEQQLVAFLDFIPCHKRVVGGKKAEDIAESVSPEKKQAHVFHLHIILTKHTGSVIYHQVDILILLLYPLIVG